MTHKQFIEYIMKKSEAYPMFKFTESREEQLKAIYDTIKGSALLEQFIIRSITDILARTIAAAKIEEVHKDE